MDIHPVLLALYAGLFTWFMTAVGAALVFFFKEIKQGVLNTMLGFAAGVMVAASFWSLLLPAEDMASEAGMTPWQPVVIGFTLGGLVLMLMDKFLPHLHPNSKDGKPEGPHTKLRKTFLFVFAVTLHNIPEGFAFGVAFGAMANDNVTFMAAAVIALGIGIQNLPEGAAISIPLRKVGFSRRKSFFIGQFSGFVEPVAAVVGAYFASHMTFLLPYALSFAAGAMMYVVIEELIPESQSSEHSHGATIGAMGGFIIMTFLDMALG